MNYQEYSTLDAQWDCENDIIPSEENVEKYKLFSWWISGIVKLIIACYGIIANNFAVLVLLCRANGIPNVVKQTLTFQILFDCCYLVCNISEAIGVIDPSDVHTKISATVFYQLKNIALCCSIGTKLILVRERYFSALWLGLPQPYSKNSWIYTTIRIILIITCSLIISIPLFYEVKEESIEILYDVGINETLYGAIESSDAMSSKGADIYDDYTLENVNGLVDAKTDASLFDSSPLNILLPTQLRFSYHYMIWYKVVILTCIPASLVMIYTFKTYRTVKIKLQNRGINSDIEIKSLTTESWVQKNGCQDVGETAGIISMVMLFIICYGTKLILLIYETANIKWIQEHFTSCMVPPILFYGKSIYDLVISTNASISIYLYFFVKANHRKINFW